MTPLVLTALILGLALYYTQLKFDWFKRQWEKGKEEIKAKYEAELEEKDSEVEKLKISLSLLYTMLN